MTCPAETANFTRDTVQWLLERPLCNQLWNIDFWTNLALLTFLVIVIPGIWLFVVAPRPAFGRRSYIPRKDFAKSPVAFGTTDWQGRFPSYQETKSAPKGPDNDANAVGSRAVAIEVLKRLRSSEATHRRVERFRFIAQKRVRRHTSIDVDLPKNSAPMPIGLFQKDPSDKTQVGLRDFSAYASELSSISLLGRHANSIVVYHALIVWLEDVISEKMSTPTPVSDDERAWIWSVVSTSRQQADENYQRLARLVRNRSDVSAKPANADPALARLVDACTTDSTLWALVSLLASNWVILVDLPASSPSLPKRVVVKMDFDDFLAPYSVQHGRIRYFLRGLGWLPSVVDIPNLASIPSQSLHVEFETPEGIELDSFVIISKPLMNREMAIDDRLTAREAALHMRAVERFGDRLDIDYRSASDSEAARHPDLGHAYLPHPGLDQQITAFAGVRNERWGPVLSALAGVFMLLGLTWIGSLHPLAAIGGPDTLLFAIPGALTGFLLFRQHDFAVRLQRPLRWTLITAVALALLALTVLTLARGELSCAALGSCPGTNEEQVASFVTNSFQYLRWGATVLAGLLFAALGPVRGTKTTEDPPR